MRWLSVQDLRSARRSNKPSMACIRRRPTEPTRGRSAPNKVRRPSKPGGSPGPPELDANGQRRQADTCIAQAVRQGRRPSSGVAVTVQPLVRYSEHKFSVANQCATMVVSRGSARDIKAYAS